MTAALVEPVTLAGLTLESFKGRPVAVLGFARSGLAAARFLADRGAQVTVYDGRMRAELEETIAALDGRSVRLLLGPAVDPAAALDGQALVVTSPSVSSRYPTTEPRLRAALAGLESEGRVPVVSEMDLFLRLCPAVTIGVTGTKGKSTTATLTAAVLGAGDAPVLLGGNVGTPLVERLPELTPAHRVVLEISELQLPTLSRGTTVAVYTHVSADHLDRHGSVAAYRAVKRRLAELARADGALVLNAEDPVSRDYAALSAAPVTFYRREEPAPGEAGVREGWIVAEGIERLAMAGGGAAVTGPGGRILPLDEIRLPGAHSVSNVLAVVAVGLLFGVGPEAIRGAAAGFAGVEHRLETVVVHKRVRYVNDSQGTQPDAVIAALESFALPLVLIAGGRSKDLSLEVLAKVVAARATAVVLIGESAADYERILRAAGHRRVERSASLEAAVARADAIARTELAGMHPSTTATVLLSPAAASFDMFADYAARGRAFRSAVEALVAGQAR